LASITQVPTPLKLTVAPLIEQAPEVEEELIENVTALPEPPPLALTVYLPPTVAPAGGFDENVIVWGSFPNVFPP